MFERMFPVDDRMAESVKEQGVDLQDALEVLHERMRSLWSGPFFVLLLLRLHRIEKEIRKIRQEGAEHLHSQNGTAVMMQCLHGVDFKGMGEDDPLSIAMTAVGPESDLAKAVKEMTAMLCAVDPAEAMEAQKEIMQRRSDRRKEK